MTAGKARKPTQAEALPARRFAIQARGRFALHHRAVRQGAVRQGPGTAPATVFFGHCPDRGFGKQTRTPRILTPRRPSIPVRAGSEVSSGPARAPQAALKQQARRDTGRAARTDPPGEGADTPPPVAAIGSLIVALHRLTGSEIEQLDIHIDRE